MWLLLLLFVVILKCDLLGYCLVWFGFVLVENICIVHWFVNWLCLLFQGSFQHLMLILLRL